MNPNQENQYSFRRRGSIAAVGRKRDAPFQEGERSPSLPLSVAMASPKVGTCPEMEPMAATTTNPRTKINTNHRRYAEMKWSLEEKKVILFCYSYSTHEIWGGIGNAERFQRELGRSTIAEKAQQSTTKKLQSLASQAHRALGVELSSTIKAEAGRKAIEDHSTLMPDKLEEELKKKHWSRAEKWTLVWVSEYANKKAESYKERAELWLELFKSRCPYKAKVPRSRLNTQKGNIKTSNVFSKEQYGIMRMEIEHILEKGELTPEDTIQEPMISHLPACDKEKESPEGSPTNPTQDLQGGEDQRPMGVGMGGDPPSPSPPSSPRSSVSGSLERSHIDDEEVDPEVDVVIQEKLANKIETVKLMDHKDRPKLKNLFETRTLKDLISKVNKAVKDLIAPTVNITDINNINFAAAWLIQELTIPGKPNPPNGNRPPNRGKWISPWKRKQLQKLGNLRKETSLLAEYRRGENGWRLERKIRRITRRHRISLEDLEHLYLENKVKITSIRQRIKNDDEVKKTREQNRMFQETPKKFYRSLNEGQINVNNPPPEEAVSDFWRGIYENRVVHNQQAGWQEETRVEVENARMMEKVELTTEDIKLKLRTAANFKSPGPDQLQNFWIKKITSLHPYYAKSFQRMIENKEHIPTWLTKGITYLLPKSEDTHLPSKYRPITCLPTTYKLLSGLIADNIYDHLNAQKLMTEEQSGCKRNCNGTKDQLLMNRAILENCRKNNKNLHIAWIDYKKAFDSVPHSWILKSLEIYKICPQIRSFISRSMKDWQTTLNLSHEKGNITIPNVKIQRGIFQGDSLSPLLFTLALDPLSKTLNKNDSGYNFAARGEPKKIFNHLLYMDDLKLYAASEEQLKQQLKKVKQFSDDICMEFGLDKCAKCSIKRGKVARTEGIQIDQTTLIRELENEEIYKYLGIAEREEVEHKVTLEAITKEYFRRVRSILKTNLTAKNKIVAINQLAVPVIQYSFGIVDWHQYQLNQVDTKTRKLLVSSKIFYKNQDHRRLYLPRKEAGMGLININESHRSTIVSLSQYIISSSSEKIKTVKTHEMGKPQSKSIIALGENFLRQKDLTHDDAIEMPDTPATVISRKTRARYMKAHREEYHRIWKDNQRAKLFPLELEKEYIDKKASIEWLTKGILRYDGERIILGAQDQALYTNGFKKLAGLTNNDKCRFCKEKVESATHLLSNCLSLLGEGHYTKRHDKICRLLHWKILEHYNIERPPNHWHHEPPGILEHGHVTIYYDQRIPVSEYIENRGVKPDIIIHDKRERTAKVIEVSVPADFGINASEMRKLNKYQDFIYALKRDWKLKETPELIPVIVGATGLVKKNLKRHLESIPGKITTLQLQTEVVRESVTILKRALGTDVR